MVTALETNFFFYRTNSSCLSNCVSFLEMENNRFNRLYALKASLPDPSYSSDGFNRSLPRYGFTDRRENSYDPVYGQSIGNGLMSMNFPSISDAFRSGDGLSLGTYGMGGNSYQIGHDISMKSDDSRGKSEERVE